MSVQQNDLAQANAPSYLHLPDDGADWHCAVCGEAGRKGFVKTFTPDGKTHWATHLECLDEDWINRAKNMGEAD